MVKIRFIQDFASKLTDEVMVLDSMIASLLIKKGVAVLHSDQQIDLGKMRNKFNK